LTPVSVLATTLVSPDTEDPAGGEPDMAAQECIPVAEISDMAFSFSPGTGPTADST
jgi:hypothetical protein